MTKARTRLGRGLSSLIGSAESAVIRDTPVVPVSQVAIESAETAEKAAMFHVELSRIRVNPYQPRRAFDAESLSLLAASLKSSGLIQPIVVREIADGFELIAGERRYRAALAAGIDRLPAVVRSASPTQQAEWALIENIHRQDLNPIDRAEAYSRLIGEFGITQEKLAERLGEDRSSIANYLRLLKLVPGVREKLVGTELTFGHAKILAGIDDLIRQQALADLVVKQSLSVRKLEALIQKPEIEVASPGKSATVKTHLADLENRLTQRLQMRVQLKTTASGKRGRLIVHYNSLDQFDQLVEQLGIVLEAD